MKDPAYLEIVPRVLTIVPQSSVIGMLLEHEESYTVIKSKQIGLLQHDFYSWVLDGPEFVPMEEVTNGSKFLDMTIKNWFSNMTPEERNETVDAVFDLLSIRGASSVSDIVHPKNVRAYLRTLATDGKLRRLFTDELIRFIDAARRTRLSLDEKDQSLSAKINP